MKDNQYLIGIGAHTELGVELFLPHSLRVFNPSQHVWQMSYYKDQKGTFGFFLVLSEHNYEQNELQAVFCSIYSANGIFRG